MNSNKRMKAAVGAFAIVTTIGLAASGAFTAGGVTNTADQDVAGFVGGHVDQLIEGAAVLSVEYTLDGTASNIVAVDIATDAPAGKAMTIDFTGGTTDTGTFACTEGAPVASPGVFECVVTGIQTVDVDSLNIQVR